MTKPADILASYDAIPSRLRPNDEIADEVIRRFPSLARHQAYPAGSTGSKLVKMLNDCMLEGKVPRSTNELMISRQYFVRKLNISREGLRVYKHIFASYEEFLEDVEPRQTLMRSIFGANPETSEPMDSNALQVVARYPEVLKHQHYPTGSSARKIVQILNSQLSGTGLVRGRAGKIDRQVFNKELGFSTSAITRYLTILTDYEDAVGGGEARVEALIPKIRIWLEDGFSSGTLQLWNSKISRVQLYDAFCLPNTKTNLIRYPLLGELVEEFDNKIISSGYLPNEVLAKLKKLKALLSDQPPLAKSGRSINKAEIKRLLELQTHQIDAPPYAPIIKEAEKHLISTLERDPLIICVGRRVLQFKSLVEGGWPSIYVARVAKNFEYAYRSKSKHIIKKHYYLLIYFLSFLASNESQICRSVFYGLGNGVPVVSLTSEFTKALQEYRDHIRAQYDHDVVCNHKLTSTNSILRTFSALSVFPTPNLYLKGFQVRAKKHLKTVAEAMKQESREGGIPHIDDYIAFATSMLTQAAEVRNIDLVVGDTGDFTRVLREELEAVTFGTADNPASVILGVLERRINFIRAAAWTKVEQGQRDLELGHILLAQAVDLGDDFDRIVNRDGMKRPERDALLRRYFPIHGDKKQGLANLLKVIKTRYNGIYPASGYQDAERRFLTARALEFGGVPKIQAYLMPSQEAVAATLTLYLLNSGSNISVGRTLYFDCIEPTEEPLHCKVTGYKARAAGKPIFAVLEDRSKAVLAMKWLQSSFRNFPNLDSEAKNQLFVCKGSRGICMMNEYTYRDEFKRLILSIPELAHLSMTPNMLRPSILLRAALESDGRTNLSLAIGQHGVKVHEGYVNKYPLRYLRDSEIRHFQHSLETVVVQAIEEAHMLLGVDPDDMSRRVETVMKTGLGTLCANRNGRPGNHGSPCTSIDCWNDCPQLIVIAKKEEVAILQVWQHSLRLVEGEWIQNQPERWEAVWLPWLCFIDAVEVKLRQAFTSVWKAATVISTKMISSPTFEPMRLF